MVYRPEIDPQLCFVLMPFKQPFFGYYERIIKPSAEKADLRAVQAGEIYGTRSVIRDIWDLIWKARVVVADVTGKNPNVNYELGMCHALGIPTVLISKREEDIPFDYRHRRYILYNTDLAGWEDELREKLTGTLRAALDESGQEELPWPYDTEAAAANQSALLIPNSTDIVAPGRTPEFLLRGADVARDLIALSYGPQGRSISIWKASQSETLTRRGNAILSGINVREPYLRTGHHYMQCIAERMYKEFGDGTKTSVLIAHELLRGAYERIESGLVPARLAREIELAVQRAADFLTHLAAPYQVDRERTVLRVAGCSAEHVALVTNVLNSAGVDDVVTIVQSLTGASRIERLAGVSFAGGYLSPYFLTDATRDAVDVEDCFVLVVDGKISSARDLIPVLEHVTKTNKSLVIVARDVDGEALSTIVINKVRGVLKAVAIGVASIAPDPSAHLRPIALATGTSVFRVDDESMSESAAPVGQPDAHPANAPRVDASRATQAVKRLANLTLADLGRARRVIALKSRTVVCGTKDQSNEDTMARAGGIVVVHLHPTGLTTFPDAKEQVDQAIRLARSVRRSGWIPGGGAALAAAARELRKMQGDHGESKVDYRSSGVQIVAAALEQPLRQLIRNSGADPALVLAPLESSASPRLGYDVHQECLADMVSAEVLDSAEVLIAALKIAHEEISQLLNIGAWHIDIDPAKKDE